MLSCGMSLADDKRDTPVSLQHEDDARLAPCFVDLWVSFRVTCAATVRWQWQWLITT